MRGSEERAYQNPRPMRFAGRVSPDLTRGRRNADETHGRFGVPESKLSAMPSPVDLYRSQPGAGRDKVVDTHRISSNATVLLVLADRHAGVGQSQRSMSWNRCKQGIPPERDRRDGSSLTV